MTDVSPQPSESSDRFPDAELQARLDQVTATLSSWANVLIADNKIGVFATNVTDLKTQESVALGIFAFSDPETIQQPDAKRTKYEARLIYIKPSQQSNDDELPVRDKLSVILEVEDPELAGLDPFPSEKSMTVTQAAIPINANGTLLYNGLARDYTVSDTATEPTNNQLEMIERAISVVQEQSPITPKPAVD